MLANDNSTLLGSESVLVGSQENRIPGSNVISGPKPNSEQFAFELDFNALQRMDSKSTDTLQSSNFERTSEMYRFAVSLIEYVCLVRNSSALRVQIDPRTSETFEPGLDLVGRGSFCWLA